MSQQGRFDDWARGGNQKIRERHKVEVKPPMTIDRSEVSRCLAKAIAYKAVGKNGEAAHWARKLVEALQLAEILK